MTMPAYQNNINDSAKCVDGKLTSLLGLLVNFERFLWVGDIACICEC